MDDHNKIPVTITYEKRGTQPPLFVAGTFSDPQWEPQEMDCTTDEDGNHVFIKTVRVAPGTRIEYKIRVGEGEWWVLNEAAPIVTDDSGNRNNVLTAPVRSPELKSATLKPNPDPVARLQQDERQRLSSTPIGQVSDTAAEVADTAQKLDAAKPDRGKAPEIQIERSSSNGPGELEDELDELDEADAPPLFAHECLGEVTYPDDEPKSPRSAIEEREHAGSVEYNLDKYDLNDPSLERWPSDRKSIIDAVRKVETCRNEDQTYFLGSPVSPIMGARRTSIDEEVLDFSGPSSPLTTKKLDAPRKKSHSSVTSTKSLTSLASIAEEGAKGRPINQVDEIEEQGSETPRQEDLLKSPQPMVSVPSPAIKVTPELFASPISDEDEGVVLKSTRSKSKLARNLETGSTTISDKSEVHTPKPTGPGPDPSKQHGKKPAPETAERGSLAGQPQRPDEMDALDDSADDDEPIYPVRPSDEPTTSDNQGHVSSQDSDAQTTQPMENKKVTGGEWLPVFLRVLFYDWIGTFLSRLFGSKEK